MLFAEALQQLEAGNAVKRGKWEDKEGYLYILPDTKHILKVIVATPMNIANYLFHKEDFVADDWMIHARAN